MNAKFNTRREKVVLRHGQTSSNPISPQSAEVWVADLIRALHVVRASALDSTSPPMPGCREAHRTRGHGGLLVPLDRQSPPGGSRSNGGRQPDLADGEILFRARRDHNCVYRIRPDGLRSEGARAGARLRWCFARGRWIVGGLFLRAKEWHFRAFRCRRGASSQNRTHARSMVPAEILSQSRRTDPRHTGVPFPWRRARHAMVHRKISFRGAIATPRQRRSMRLRLPVPPDVYAFYSARRSARVRITRQ